MTTFCCVGRRPWPRGVIVVDSGVYLGIADAAGLIGLRGARRKKSREAHALNEELKRGIGQRMENLIGFTERLGRQSLPADARAWNNAIAEISSDLRDLTQCAGELRAAQAEGVRLQLAPCRLRDLADMIDNRWSGETASGLSGIMVSYDGDPSAAAVLDAGRVASCFDALIHRARAAARGHPGGTGVIEACLRVMPTAHGLLLQGEVRDSIGSLGDHGPLAPETLSTDLTVRLRMALATRALEAMGGLFEVDQATISGARIVFQIELEAARMDLVPEPQQLAVTDRPVRVLVVDDNATNRMVAESLCSLFGCVCESAVDGVEAVQAVSERLFDVILMDIRMPRMDGIEATRAIRKLPGPAGATPIIALTANADPLDVQSYLEAGMQDAVEKPVKAERLAQALDAALSLAEPLALKVPS